MGSKIRETASEGILSDSYQHAKDSSSVSLGTQRMEEHLFHYPVFSSMTSMPLKVT